MARFGLSQTLTRRGEAASGCATIESTVRNLDEVFGLRTVGHH